MQILGLFLFMHLMMVMDGLQRFWLMMVAAVMVV
ncbi:Uncharacterised protein [Vibrio cholerae]|nr:Uncharacterised protein [Vibrio cholerae]